MKETMKYFKPYIPYILAAVVLLFAEAMLELALPGYMADIIDDGIIAGDMKQIYKIGILMIGISAAIVLCATGVSLFASKTAARSARDIRKAVFRKVMYFANEEMEDFSTADTDGCGNDPEAWHVCAGNGYRRNNQSTENQCVACMDHRHSLWRDSNSYGIYVYHYTSKVQGCAGKGR